VVVQSDNANQVIGYVFYGECRGAANPAQTPWSQPVDKPGTGSAAQSTTQPKRVGAVTPSQTQVKSSVPAATADPLDTSTPQPLETKAFFPSAGKP
jgi:hypothetical protein